MGHDCSVRLGAPLSQVVRGRAHERTAEGDAHLYAHLRSAGVAPAHDEPLPPAWCRLTVTKRLIDAACDLRERLEEANILRGAAPRSAPRGRRGARPAAPLPAAGLPSQMDERRPGTATLRRWWPRSDDCWADGTRPRPAPRLRPARQADRGGGGLEPSSGARRVVQQHREQPARRQPQQEHTRQPERQHRFSCSVLTFFYTRSPAMPDGHVLSDRGEERRSPFLAESG